MNSNRLSGSIPESLSDLSNLTVLDLSANNLSGVIPVNLTLLSGLRRLNVSRNNLEGEIPNMLGSRFNDPSAFAFNRDLCGKPLNRKCENVTKTNKKKKRLILLIAITVAGACLTALCCCYYIFSLLQWRKRLRQGDNGKKKRSPARVSSGAAEGGRGSGENGNGGPKIVMFNNKLTNAETLVATRQFDEENVLSRGRYGLVFKACFQDGTVLSIHRLPDGSIDEGTFSKGSRVAREGETQEPNSPSRILCWPTGRAASRVRYMPNGNLATLLQEASHQDGHVLNWPMRHLIALGVARGLAFLHTASMVHGDIKPQNVLFDADFKAHLSDFELNFIIDLNFIFFAHLHPRGVHVALETPRRHIKDVGEPNWSFGGKASIKCPWIDI